MDLKHCAKTREEFHVWRLFTPPSSGFYCEACDMTPPESDSAEIIPHVRRIPYQLVEKENGRVVADFFEPIKCQYCGTDLKITPPPDHTVF